MIDTLTSSLSKNNWKTQENARNRQQCFKDTQRGRNVVYLSTNCWENLFNTDWPPRFTGFLDITSGSRGSSCWVCHHLYVCHPFYHLFSSLFWFDLTCYHPAHLFSDIHLMNPKYPDCLTPISIGPQPISANALAGQAPPPSILCDLQSHSLGSEEWHMAHSLSISFLSFLP